METYKAEATQLKVLNFIRCYQLIKPVQKVLLAVSGGADSVCLLHILNQLKSELQIDLHVAHINHQLRGAEADTDANFVQALAGRFSLPFTLEKLDVLTYQSEHKLSLEEAAREVRYAFLAETAESIGAAGIAVGHNQNDQVETILLHIIRGSGTRGLRGLQPASNVRFAGSKQKIIRPLLLLSRAEIESYCEINDLQWRTDSSNTSLALLRNRVRLELLPLLKNYNSGIADSLLRFGRIAEDDLAFLENETDKIWSQVAVIKEGSVIFDKKELGCLPLALKRQILRRAVECILGNLKDIETRHIEVMLEALSLSSGRHLDLPQGMIFAIEPDRYYLSLHPSALVPFPEIIGEHVLRVPGKTDMPGWQIETSLDDQDSCSFDAESRETWLDDGFTAHFDLDKTGKELIIRNRRRGDSFQPLGMTQLKKVARFMLDAQIPAGWRERIPLLCNPQQVLWLAGWRIDGRVKVTPQTQHILRVRLTKTK